MRILCLDVGSKTIGVAVSDPMGWTAQGVTTVRRRNGLADDEAIARLIREYEARQILVGLPINMNGTEGPQAEAMRKYARHLGEKFSLPILLWDERLSTVAAGEFLAQASVKRAKRKRVIDKMAAVFILQGYLDSLRADKGLRV